MHPITRQLHHNITQKGSYVCVGLDPDIKALPIHLPRSIDGVNSFLNTIIENTADLAIAYKANISFFESMGLEGLKLLSTLRNVIPRSIPLIIDGKRGDIGNTSRHQAAFLFDHMGADASTVNPYMGIDALSPFFDYKDKLHFVLVLTSNPGAADFERLTLSTGKTLSEAVLAKCTEWQRQFGNLGCVVGATQSELPQLRSQDQSLPYLIPGVGAQGGSYTDAVRDGINQNGVVIVNVGRSILYASAESNFGSAAKAALQLTVQLPKGPVQQVIPA